MKITLELPIWAGQTLIGYLSDVVVDVVMNRHGQVQRVLVPSFRDTDPPLRVFEHSTDTQCSSIWRLVDEAISSGKHDSEIAEHLAEMREAEREYARELRHDYASA